MNYTQTLKQAWRLVWNLRTVWVFGFLLALTTSSPAFWLWEAGDRDAPSGVVLRVSQSADIKLFGEGLLIDFTTPGGPRVRLSEGYAWGDMSRLADLVAELVPDGVRPILIFAGIELALLLLLGALARYTSEAAVIHAVGFHEESGGTAGFRQIFRWGWSRTAWRFLGIDLAVKIPVGLGLALLFGLALSPLALLAADSPIADVFAGVMTAALLIVWLLAAGFTIPASSLVTQVSWRACALGSLRAWASLRQGIAALRKHPGEVTLTWFVWWIAGLLWVLASVPVMILLAPLALVGILVGAVLGIGPALLTLGISSLWLQGIAPWVMAAMVGLPIFVILVLSPVLLVGGWVRMFQSNLWTLVYRQLPDLEPVAPRMSPEPGVAGGVRTAPAG